MSTKLVELMDAVARGDADAAELALKRGANINGTLGQSERAESGWIHPDVPPVTWATRKSPKMIDWLVERGAKLELRSGHAKETPLITAARQGLALKSVQRLIDAGAKVDVTDKDRMTPLGYAASNGKLKLVQALLAAGANPDVGLRDPNFGLPGVPTYTPLYEATVREKRDCAFALLDAGANPNTGRSDQWLQSPLGMAIKNGDRALCRRLVEAGARTEANVLSSGLKKKLLKLLGGSLPAPKPIERAAGPAKKKPAKKKAAKKKPAKKKAAEKKPAKKKPAKKKPAKKKAAKKKPAAKKKAAKKKATKKKAAKKKPAKKKPAKKKTERR